MSFLQVSGPTMASVARWAAVWKASAACLVFAPAIPSTVRGGIGRAVLADVAGGEEEIQQCLQRLDVLARDWLQLGLPKVDRLHLYHDLRHDPAPFLCRPFGGP